MRVRVRVMVRIESVRVCGLEVRGRSLGIWQ